jgi:hypothetical protein
LNKIAVNEDNNEKMLRIVFETRAEGCQLANLGIFLAYGELGEF